VTPGEASLAVVAGGAGTLGSRVAHRLADLGHHVVILDRAGHDDERTTYVKIDLTDEEDVTTTLNAVTGRHGPPAVLVNCQGWSPKGADGRAVPDDEFGKLDFLRVLDVNLVSSYLLMRRLVPMMAGAGGGRVVNVSSTAASTGRTTAGPAYAAAKAGLDALTRSFAVRYGPHNVLVCGVAPGKLRNPAWPDAPEALAAYRSEIPLGRLADPDEVAAFIVRLASDANTYVTGQTIAIDGGRTA
jgi:NAD(P)-dependent dehydrogenase (short-subunit alcohol dehydrogenase family)